MIQESVTFPNTNNELLDGIIRIPDGAGPAKKLPAVILCHDFNQDKGNELIVGLWDSISRAGFVCLRFDFTGHGESQGNFRELTVLQEIHDVLNAVEFLKSTNLVDEKRIAIVGHGLGASVAILSAERQKFKAVAGVDGASNLTDYIESKFNKNQIVEWKKKGFIQFHNFDELSKEFLDDSRKHDIIASLGKINCPLLIVHGSDDKEIPFENAREIFNHAPAPKTLELVEGADHLFRDSFHREHLYGVLVDFLVKNVR